MSSIFGRLSNVANSPVFGLASDRILEWTIGNRLFELGDAGPSVRVASWFGYGSVLALLGAMLGLQLLGVGLPASGTTAPGDPSLRTPVQVVVIACMGFVAAWALIMTGALYVRRGIAVILLAAFAIQVSVVGARVIWVSILLIALAVCAQLLFRGRPALRAWNQTPVVSLIAWVLLLSGLVIHAWTTESSARFVSLFMGVMSMTSALAIGLWVAMASAAGVSAVRLSITIVNFLRGRVSPTTLQIAAVLLGALVGPGGMTFGIVDKEPAWIIGGAVSLALIPATIILSLTQRWTDRNANVIIGLCLAILIFTSSLSLAMNNSGRIGRGVQATGIFPPILLFLVLAADNLLRFGKPIKRVAPRLGSQVAWVLIYLGGVVLVVTALLFLTSHPSALTGQMSQAWPRVLASLTTGTMLVTGPIYLIWVVCRRAVWWGGLGDSKAQPTPVP